MGACDFRAAVYTETTMKTLLLIASIALAAVPAAAMADVESYV